MVTEIGGDEVCWLRRTCPECGAMIERPGEACWRCGAEPPAQAELRADDAGGHTTDEA